MNCRYCEEPVERKEGESDLEYTRRVCCEYCSRHKVWVRRSKLKIRLKELDARKKENK